MYSRATNLSTTRPRRSVGWPRSKKVVLTYVQQFTNNPGAAGSVTGSTFSCNGMYDPDVSGVGHQPLGFDQWMAMYDHYRVIRSKIQVDFTRKSGETTNTICGLWIDDDNAAYPADPTALLEQPGCVYGILAHSSSAPLTLRRNWDAKEHFGKAMWDDLRRGSAGAQPNDQMYFRMFVASADGGDGGDVEIMVTIEYEAVLTEQKTLTQS